MIAIQKKPATFSNSAAALMVAAALAAVPVGAYAAAPAQYEPAGASEMMHKAGHHKGHGKHRGGMRSMLKGLDLTEAQRDQIFEIRHASMPAFREQRKQMRAARQALRALSTQADVDAADLQAQTDALGRAVAAMAMLRVQSMNQVMNVLTEEQAATVREKMQAQAERGRGQHRHGGGGYGKHGSRS